jgi:hypothetical protein
LDGGTLPPLANSLLRQRADNRCMPASRQTPIELPAGRHENKKGRGTVACMGCQAVGGTFMVDRSNVAQDRFAVGYHLLGPILLEYCYRLWVFQCAYGDRAAAALHMARGGLRLGYLYRNFLAKNGLQAPVPQFAFPVSRFVAAKTCMGRDPAFCAAAIAREFQHTDCRAMANCLIPKRLVSNVEQLVNDLPSNLASARVTPESFMKLYHAQGPYSQALRRHFAEQEELFDEWMKSLAEYDTLLLVDTGWYASTQAAYMRSQPQWEWIGLYFGRWNNRGVWPSHFSHVHGLMLDGERCEPGHPETALLRHHHLIEMPLEPIGMESVAYYFRDDAGRVRSNLDPAVMDAQIASNEEPFFAGIQAYFAEAESGLEFASIRRACDESLRRLSPMILCPNPRIARTLTVADRGDDFGKTDRTPVLSPPAAAGSWRSRWRQTRAALWREGQAAIEFPRTHRLLQILIATQWRHPGLYRHLRNMAGKWSAGAKSMLRREQ